MLAYCYACGVVPARGAASTSRVSGSMLRAGCTHNRKQRLRREGGVETQQNMDSRDRVPPLQVHSTPTR